jgi:hypothetical protein
MPQEDDDLLPSNRCRVPQTLAGALIAGSITINVVAAILVWSVNGGQGFVPNIGTPTTILAGVLLAVNLLLAAFVPNLVAKQLVGSLVASGRMPPDRPGRIAALFGALTAESTIRMALLEAPALLGALAFIMGANPWAIGLSASAVFFMILAFPQVGWMKRWMAQRLEEVACRDAASTA